MNADTARTTIALSLVSHTNVGKTTLARTLLQRDIGEVRDDAHVTLDAERHTLIETAEGDRLELWDTPGFGNSQRLAARLARADNPIGWFMNEVWDRWRDRALWSSQAAVRNVLEEADAVLYLVNASEAPQDAAYVDPELKVLDLLDKPAIVLLNQIGQMRSPADEAAQIERWWAHCAEHPCVRAVLALDAFARCWVQEGTLLNALADVLPA
ncbi:MAG: GTPase domain-containing protein, partial [Burkholderiales bacterium]